jgi:hypothetical protein
MSDEPVPEGEFEIEQEAFVFRHRRGGLGQVGRPRGANMGAGSCDTGRDPRGLPPSGTGRPARIPDPAPRGLLIEEQFNCSISKLSPVRIIDAYVSSLN